MQECSDLAEPCHHTATKLPMPCAGLPWSQQPFRMHQKEHELCSKQLLGTLSAEDSDCHRPGKQQPDCGQGNGGSG